MSKWKLLSSVFCIAALSLSGGMMHANAAEEGTISKGVYIGDVDVSGMTVQQAEQAVQEAVNNMESASLTIKVGTDTTTATASQLGAKWGNTEVVEEAAGVGKSGNLLKRYKENKDLQHEPQKLDIKYTTDTETVRSFVETNCKSFEKEAQNGSLTMEDGELKLVPSVIGQKINVSESVNTITNFMNNDFSGTGGEITLPVEQDKPKVGDEELSKVKDVLGSYTTYYGSTTGRNQNVERGAELLNGHVLYPGESFSVTDAVVPFNAENGYEMAPSYESGRVVESYGGGICQVSTTMYNALLEAELNITERSNHTMIVTYVEPSMDAAIAEGLMDLKFENNTDAPIYIAAYAYGGELNFTIYGHEARSPERTVEYVSEVTRTIPAEGVMLYAKTDQNVGYLQNFQSPHEGMEARLWKVVTENGVSEKTQVNSSVYQAAAMGYEVGTYSADPNTSAAINNAIAANDLNSVQSIIAGGTVTPAVTDPTQTPETDPNQTPQTDPTEPPQTDAPQTDPVSPPEPEPVPPPDPVPPPETEAVAPPTDTIPAPGEQVQ